MFDFTLTQFSRIVFHMALIFSILALATACQAQSMPQKFKDRQYGVRWVSLPLRETLRHFADLHQVEFILDRRVDPSLPVHFEISNARLDELFEGLADSLDLDCVFVGETLYLGPSVWVEGLPRLLEHHNKTIAKLPSRTRNVWQKKTKINIPTLGSPRDTLEDIAAKNNFDWANLNDLPHDLWNETRLTGLSLNETISVLLFGFGFDYEIDGRTLRLVPLKFPEEHEQATMIRDSQKAKNMPRPITQKNEGGNTDRSMDGIPLSRRRFTLKIENQKLDAVLEVLTDRIGLELELNERSLAEKGVLKDQPVSVEVKNATVQQLFQKLLKPIKLEFKIENNSIMVY